MEDDWTRRRRELFERLEVGDLLTGTVAGLASYGAFVDLGGAYGLIHRSELSWDPVRRVTDVVNLGDRVNVRVFDLVQEENRIALSLRRAGQEGGA